MTSLSQFRMVSRVQIELRKAEKSKFLQIATAMNKTIRQAKHHGSRRQKVLVRRYGSQPTEELYVRLKYPLVNPLLAKAALKVLITPSMEAQDRYLHTAIEAARVKTSPLFSNLDVELNWLLVERTLDGRDQLAHTLLGTPHHRRQATRIRQRRVLSPSPT